MSAAQSTSWRRRLGLERGAGALAAGLFVYGFGEELWFRYLPAFLRFLGASAFTVGAFGTLKDLLDAAYAYPGGVLTDRLGSRRALLLFGALTTAGFVLYLAFPSIPMLFAGLLLVMAWQSLGLPATFTLLREEMTGDSRLVGFTVQSVVKRLPIVLAPPLGGYLIGRFGMAAGMRFGFSLSIVLSILMLLGLWRAFRRRDVPVDPADPGHPDQPRSKVRLHPVLVRLLIADCLIRLCEGLPEVFLVVWALEIAHLSAARFGVLTAILMITAILSYVPAAILAGRAEKKPFVVLTYVFFTLFPLGVVFAHSFAALAGTYVLGGLREIGEPARKSLIVDLAISDPGRTVGLYYTIRGFAVAGAAAIGGALWTIRPELTFYVAGALGMAGTLWAALMLPSHPTVRKDHKETP
ncbi:MAG TPA: MFS transporter [Thermoanaerobaculia bacterium]|jgi:MFS family permease|nr:MFS transporter [Thermoanaerobaculia bacterium]